MDIDFKRNHRLFGSRTVYVDEQGIDIQDLIYKFWKFYFKNKYYMTTRPKAICCDRGGVSFRNILLPDKIFCSKSNKPPLSHENCLLNSWIDEISKKIYRSTGRQCRPVTFLYYVQNPFLPPTQKKKKLKKISKFHKIYKNLQKFTKIYKNLQNFKKIKKILKN